MHFWMGTGACSSHEGITRPIGITLSRGDEKASQRHEDSPGELAFVNDLPLMTRNRNHFAAIEGLRLVPLYTRES